MMRTISSIMVAGVLAVALTSCANKLFILDGESMATKDDIREIKALVAARRDIRQPVYAIFFKSPTLAEVSSGDHSKEDYSCCRDTFMVTKRNGRWVISSKIKTEHFLPA